MNVITWVGMTSFDLTEGEEFSTRNLSKGSAIAFLSLPWENEENNCELECSVKRMSRKLHM